MAEKDNIFSSSVKYTGVLSFKDFYKFCHEWQVDETGLDLAETVYKEKLSGDSKNIEIKWVGETEVTDYFKFQIETKFKITKLTKVEIMQDGVKIKTNKGGIKVGVKGFLIRDYKGKFEQNAFLKFLRSIYEKWIIVARIDQMEEKLVEDCDEFLEQAKAYMDLEGKK